MLDPAGDAVIEAKAGGPPCLGIIVGRPCRVQKRDSLGRQDEDVALGDSLASVLSPSSLEFDDCARLLVCGCPDRSEGELSELRVGREWADIDNTASESGESSGEWFGGEFRELEWDDGGRRSGGHAQGLVSPGQSWRPT